MRPYAVIRCHLQPSIPKTQQLTRLVIQGTRNSQIVLGAAARATLDQPRRRGDRDRIWAMSHIILAVCYRILFIVQKLLLI